MVRLLTSTRRVKGNTQYGTVAAKVARGAGYGYGTVLPPPGPGPCAHLWPNALTLGIGDLSSVQSSAWFLNRKDAQQVTKTQAKNRARLCE